ncbi:lipid A export ATP-binding/permease protein msba, putative [Talaromyces stipitatus ATCC 10500]|uniref:Lipid A export ATP-binding/permease protein msba, putative n=1 Tax=Talaromyces stipitatus (strain ATCC 10500 / CBS 375.48 / QM 6759 / NRRL 1006) TaxID=441959 RepID=B8MUN2_TALSN|nr:lipid A export ATP-binding/permease protein msba, putative [Talaromyces stipitatus ATCC 10500]EED11700.1 lipid A export ATP-binding/permease protein msba, putative [Talaromyces stipitatus ATCC 10500]
MEPRKKEIIRDYRLAVEECHRLLLESFSNWYTVISFGRIGYEKEQYGRECVEKALQTFILDIGLLSALSLASHQITHEKIPLSNLVILLTWWPRLIQLLLSIAGGFDFVKSRLPDTRSFLELIQRQPTVAEHSDAKPMSIKGGKIQFINVSFCYDHRYPALKNVTFDFLPGQVIGVVGETGGGKSTISNLLCRFYDPTSGCIRIDEQDIRGITQNSLRDAIVVSPQQQDIFTNTIMYNIRYAKPSASDAEVYEVCKIVQAHDQFLRMGYDKIIKKEIKLSGGQIQKIGIARALLKDTPIIILDEPTSAIDPATESNILENIRIRLQGRTIIIITHRLPIVVNANHILVIRDGRLVQQGTHKELLQGNNYYRELWSQHTSLGKLSTEVDYI